MFNKSRSVQAWRTSPKAHIRDAAQGGFLLELALPAEDRFYDDKADVLEVEGLTTDAQFTLLADREPSEALLGFLRLLNLSGAKASRLFSRVSVW